MFPGKLLYGSVMVDTPDLLHSGSRIGHHPPPSYVSFLTPTPELELATAQAQRTSCRAYVTSKRSRKSKPQKGVEYQQMSPHPILQRLCVIIHNRVRGVDIKWMQETFWRPYCFHKVTRTTFRIMYILKTRQCIIYILKTLQ